MCSVFTGAGNTSAACPLLSHAKSICFMIEPTSVVECKQTPVQVGGKAPCRKLVLIAVYPLTDPHKVGSSAEGKGASLPVGILPSKQMDPLGARSKTRMLILDTCPFFICLFHL